MSEPINPADEDPRAQRLNRLSETGQRGGTSTSDRRHCLICGTWWPLENDDTPRECPHCQERGTAATQPCRQPGCPWQRGHDYGEHELTGIAIRSQALESLRDNEQAAADDEQFWFDEAGERREVTPFDMTPEEIKARSGRSICGGPATGCVQDGEKDADGSTFVWIDHGPNCPARGQA